VKKKKSDTVSLLRFQGRSTIAILAMVIVGLLFLLASINMEKGFWASLLNQLSTVLLVGGIWTGSYELFMRRDFIKINEDQTSQVLDRITLAEGEDALGLVEVLHDSTDFDYTPLLLEAEHLTIVLNDGRTWISTHNDDLRHRLADEDKTTTIFLLHPESPMLHVLARKVDSTRDNLRSKISESIQMLKNLSIEGKTNLEILGHHLYNPHSTFLGDDIAILTLYFTARGRRTVPLLKFKDKERHGFLKMLREDLTDLRNDAEEISDFKFVFERTDK